MKRRSILCFTVASLATLSLPALAQQEKRVRRIGYFTQGNAQLAVPGLTAFRQGMTALQWIEGRDYTIEARFADSASEAIPRLVDELVSARPDLLLVNADSAVRIFAQKSGSIPIVFTIAVDPVATGIVASLQRPGGNATGLTSLSSDLGIKRLQLLREAVPRANHVGVLHEPADAGSVSETNSLRSAAERLRMRVTPIALRQPEDIEPAFKRGAELGVQAYLCIQGPLVSNQSRSIVEHVKRARRPAMFWRDADVEAGGLMSYSASIADNYRRAAAYVIKILNGAKPGDLPVEQPTRFALVLNLKTAKSIGVSFPKAILARADRVIE